MGEKGVLKIWAISNKIVVGLFARIKEAQNFNEGILCFGFELIASMDYYKFPLVKKNY